MEEADEPLTTFFQRVRQGHVLTAGAEDGDKLVVVSQTCDVVLSKRPTVSVARVVSMSGDSRAQAASGANPRFIPLPELGDSYFADLCYIESREKHSLLNALIADGINLGDPYLVRNFSLAISRWFGRFPFPDEVVPWLRPLEKVIREKYRKKSPIGELLRDVIVEIRVEESTQWAQSPYSLTVHTIVRAEYLPTLPDDGLGDQSTFVSATTLESDGSVKAAAALAEVFANEADLLRRGLILSALAESFAASCSSVGAHVADDSIASAVVLVEGELWGDDEFPLARVRRSEPLDLEYLSEPSAQPEHSPDPRSAPLCRDGEN